MLGKLFFILFFLLLFSCQKKSRNPDIEVFGHGGFGLEIPSSIYHGNSKESILQALLTKDCDGTEIDVHLSI
jgi:glycerophosphoryl diester phosphodiesterase